MRALTCERVNPRARARLRRDFGSVRESREVEFEQEVTGKHAGKDCLKASLFLYLVQALHIRFASYSIGNKWYTRVWARVSCSARMKLCSLLPTGWSAAPAGATLTDRVSRSNTNPRVLLFLGRCHQVALTCGKEPLTLVIND